MSISQLITGIAMIIAGLILVGISFYVTFVILVYGLPILIIGIFILLNKKEDKIEKIREVRKKNE